MSSSSSKRCRSTTSCSPLGRPTPCRGFQQDGISMGSLEQPADSYRLIITRRNASEILLFTAGRKWILPLVEIERHQRVAEQLMAKAAAVWKIETYCLFVPRD